MRQYKNLACGIKHEKKTQGYIIISMLHDICPILIRISRANGKLYQEQKKFRSHFLCLS